MSKKPIAEDLERFVLENVVSVEQLEILLLVSAGEDRIWTPDAVARELRSSPRSAARWLEDLRSRRLVAVAAAAEPGSYRYEPFTDGLRALVEALREFYGSRRVTVIDLIFDKSRTKLQIFADAFRIREDR